MKRKFIYLSFTLAFLMAIISCNLNSRLTNPSDYIRYAGGVNGGKGTNGGGKLEYKILTINVAGNGSVLVNNREYATELKFPKSTKVKIEAVEDPTSGEEFQGFSGSIISSNYIEEFTMDKDIILTASFVIPTVYKELRLTIRKGGGVEVDGVLHKNIYETNIALIREYEEGTIVSLKAIPNDNAIIFGGWSGSVESMDKAITVTMDKIITLAASFSTEKQVTIDYPPNSYIEVSVGNSPISAYSNETANNTMVYVDVEVGDKVNITTAPINDRTHEFVEWTSGATSYSTQKTIEFTVDKDIILTAIYKQIMRTLTIGTPTKGQAMSYEVNDKPYAGPIDLPRDSTVKVEAIEKYYELESWGGDINGTGRVYSFTLDENKTINASFKTGAFDTYDNPKLNGYNASAFDTWVIYVPDFGSKEIPAYHFGTKAYFTNKPLFKPPTVTSENKKWTATNNITLGGVVVSEMSYSGLNALAAGFETKSMNYYLYKGINYYMMRDKSSDSYNNGFHANRLKRFYFYRFRGNPPVGDTLDNALCVVDTYTKLAWAYAVPADFGTTFGQIVPTLWKAIEEKDEYNYKFYEYDPIGYVKSDGKVVLFKTFKDTQSEAAGKGDYKLYLPKAPSTTPAVAFDETDKLSSLNIAGGNRSPYLE